MQSTRLCGIRCTLVLERAFNRHFGGVPSIRTVLRPGDPLTSSTTSSLRTSGLLNIKGLSGSEWWYTLPVLSNVGLLA